MSTRTNAGEGTAVLERTWGGLDLQFSRRALIGWTVALLLAIWTAVAWFWSRAPEAVGDMMGWREVDTQTIALNFLRPGSSIFFPQINWGGDGPGYVEAEFQLYPAIVALIMRLSGPAEWPGQLVSLIAVTGAAVALFFHHRRREGALPAIAAMAAFLGTRSAAQLGTAIQPDSLALLGYTLAWIGFSTYVEKGSRLHLLMFGICGATAMLVKPTTAHIGISSGLLLLFSARHLLKRWEVWLTWALMVGVLAAYLIHAKGLYETYGNTFGLLSGGDSKSPKLMHLLVGKVWLGAGVRIVFWGLGVLGLFALAWLAVKRQLTAEHAALAIGNLVLVVLALRYVSANIGPHYLAPFSVLGASAVARVVQVGFDSRRALRLGFAGVCAIAALQICGSQWLRHRNRVPNSFTRIPIETGMALKEHAGPDSLIVVRSYKPAYDPEWQTENNYQDPTIFYITGARGWEIGSEQLDPALVADFVRRGARFLADPIPAETANLLYDWLERNAELLTTTEHGGRIWRLAK